MKFKLILVLSIFCFVIITNHSCRKSDSLLTPNDGRQVSYDDKFFNSHRTNDYAENKLVQFIKNANIKNNFVNNLVPKIGFPRWDKMLTYGSKYNSNSFAQNNDSTHTYYIPLVRDSQNFVNSSLIIVADPSDTTFRFNSDWQYKYLQNSPTSVLDTAENFAILFMKLDREVFGYKKFKILDQNLFKKDNKKALRVELLDSVPQNNMDLGCSVTTISWEDCTAPTSDQCSNGCDNCWQCTSELIFEFCSGLDVIGISDGTGGYSGPSGQPGNGGCSGCGAGGQQGPSSPGGGGGWQPVIVNDGPPPQTPCEIAQYKARQMDSAYAKSNVDSVLATIPNLATETKEKAFPIFRKFSINPLNPSDTTFTNIFKTGFVQTGTDTSFNITFAIPYLYEHVCTLHTHPSKNYSANSAKDVFELIGEKLQNNNYTGSLIVAADGSQYSLNVTDIAQAAAFYSTIGQNLIGQNWNESSNIGKAFKAANEDFETKFKGNPNKNNLAYEMAMAAVLNQFNTGVTLSKKDNTGKFKPIIVKTTPNPNKPRKKIYTQECL
ncbi:MAG: hypothetical protein ABL929_12435 [Ferruginibacter sp.]